MVYGKIKLKLRRYQAAKEKPGTRYNTRLLQDATTREAFQVELGNQYEVLENLDGDQSVEESWRHAKAAWTQTCSTTLGKRQGQHKDWMSATTLQKIEERRKRKATLNESRTRAAKAEAHRLHTEANQEVKRSVKRDKRNFVEDLARQAEEAAGRNNLKDLYDITKKLPGSKRSTDHPVNDKNGEAQTDETRQLERWKEYFAELLNRPAPDNPLDIPPADRELLIKTSRPSKAEIKKAIGLLKNGKAPGPDGIPPEALKADVPTSVDMLHTLFGKIWEEEEIPEDWKHGHIIKLPKKGNLKECKNWRGITLLSIPGKVLNRILLERMKTAVDDRLRDEQAGFRKGRSCTDQIATLRIILEQSMEWQSSLYVTFVDFEKAFDSVDRNTLWKLLAHHGIPKKIINLIRKTYEPSSCQVVHNGSLTSSFNILTGVRQGCLLSPFLFLLAIDWVMKTALDGHSRGVQWTLFSHLEDIDFADDVTLLSHRQNDMQNKAVAVDGAGSDIGLKINIPKSKTMRANQTNEDPITIRGVALEDVERFPHLGSIVCKDGGTDEDIAVRIGKATGVFKALRPLWDSRVIRTNTKLRIFNTNVKSTLLFACQM